MWRKNGKIYFEKTLKKDFFSVFGVDYRRSAIYIVDCSKKIEKDLGQGCIKAVLGKIN